MSPVRLLPDAERLVGDFLRGHTDVVALVGTRVTTALPREPTWPAVTLSRLGGVPSLAGYLDDARLELACYGATKQQAHGLARTVEAAMLTIVGVRALGTVTYVVEEGEGLRWDPDEAFEPDQPRYRMLFDVYLHP